MTRTIDAVYEGGVLRPIQTLEGIAEHARVKVTVETVEPSSHHLSECIGILPNEDAEEMRHIIKDQFERVDRGSAGHQAPVT